MSPDSERILSSPPFDLDAEAIAWVDRQLESLSLTEKIHQLFVLLMMDDRPETVALMRDFKPGGVSRIVGPDHGAEVERVEALRADATVPLLLAGDTEGSRTSLPFGTSVPNQLAMAAIDDEDAQRAICEIIARDAASIGMNMSFTLVVDICANPHSAIVPTRGFGSDVDRIARLARCQIDVLQAHGIAATAKHWPGDGHDARDQHLLTSINPLPMDEWRATFGRLYSEMIDAGVLAVMSAHIALPSYVTDTYPDGDVELYRPATVSKPLNISLLREELGFNGLVISDSTVMAGLSSWGPIDTTTPELIENGCDLILFSDDPLADAARIASAREDGRLSEDRFEAALTRALGLKAALALHEEPVLLRAIGSRQEDAEKALTITRRAPTLVKDTQRTLPLSVDEHRKLYVFSSKIISPTAPPLEFAMLDMLRDEGFEVTIHEPGFNPRPWAGHDAVLYLLGEESALTRQQIFLNWAQIAGNFIQAMKRPWHELPTALVSFGHPFYLIDAPRMPCVVNAYSTIDPMQEAVVDCLLGREPFVGQSPVDPTGGVPDAIY